VLAATDPSTTEIIVADSLSEDGTAEIAARYPVRVVQPVHVADRGCGAGAQLGFQHARGRRVLLMDGDMELAAGFLPAAQRALDEDERLAGVGGLVIDRVMTLEFQRRNRQPPANTRPGIHDHLSGGGLFRREALREVGYLTDRNLHACEELELGMRLSARGWRLKRLEIPAVDHHGHATPPFRLLLSRWRTKYVFGQGELLRAKWHTRERGRVLRGSALYLGVVAWWCLVLALIVATILSGGRREWAAGLVLVLLLPLALQAWRKRSVAMGLYSVGLLSFHAAGLIAGLLRRRRDPAQPIESTLRNPAL
jgi:GT2 family glycosyltransferase